MNFLHFTKAVYCKVLGDSHKIGKHIKIITSSYIIQTNANVLPFLYFSIPSPWVWLNPPNVAHDSSKKNWRFFALGSFGRSSMTGCGIVSKLSIHVEGPYDFFEVAVKPGAFWNPELATESCANLRLQESRHGKATSEAFQVPILPNFWEGFLRCFLLPRFSISFLNLLFWEARGKKLTPH